MRPGRIGIPADDVRPLRPPAHTTQTETPLNTTLASDTTRIRRVAAVLLAVYAVAVIVVVAWPTPVDAGSHAWLSGVLKSLHSRHLLMFLSYPLIEFTSNVIMFVPLGLLVGVLFGRRRWAWAIALGCGVSALIELLQFLLLPGRFGTIDDVIANTLGALIGALIARSILAWRIRRALHP